LDAGFVEVYFRTVAGAAPKITVLFVVFRSVFTSLKEI
jgi:hypothetical protein